jgi:hypothetical protein
MVRLEVDDRALVLGAAVGEVAQLRAAAERVEPRAVPGLVRERRVVGERVVEARAVEDGHVLPPELVPPLAVLVDARALGELVEPLAVSGGVDRALQAEADVELSAAVRGARLRAEVVEVCSVSGHARPPRRSQG